MLVEDIPEEVLPSSSQVLEEVSKTCIKLILKEPFYGHFFTSIIKSVTDEVPTAGVRMLNSFNIELGINRRFWYSLEEKKRYGLIKHEVLHIVLKHIVKARTKEMPDALIANLACDLVVNQYIEEDCLPDKAIRYVDFKEMGVEYGVEIKAEMDAVYYYKKLKKIQELYREKLNTYRLKSEDESFKPSDFPELEDIFAKSIPLVANHDGWRDIANLSDPEKKIIGSAIDRMVKNTIERTGKSKLAGSIPLSILKELNTIMESFVPNVDWRRALRMFSASGRRTYLKNTMKRQSKRYGTNPGFKITSRHHLLIGVDTSGSIDMVELRAFFSEVYHIWKQGIEVTIAEFDYEIQQVYSYKGKVPQFVKGGGGTSFDPLIDLANTKVLPDAIVVFTDGYAKKVKLLSRKPVMWMVSAEGTKAGEIEWEQLSGRKIKMKSIQA